MQNSLEYPLTSAGDKIDDAVIIMPHAASMPRIERFMSAIVFLLASVLTNILNYHSLGYK